jgi:hypothetical protein
VRNRKEYWGRCGIGSGAIAREDTAALCTPCWKHILRLENVQPRAIGPKEVHDPEKSVGPLMPVQARRFVRKMRGGAQSHLIEANDGRFYVVKFKNNPQHRRVLVNEWLASHFLRHLQIATPETAVIEVSAEFLRENPEVCISLAMRRSEVEPGLHFGSCFPGDPAKVAVYDFLPDVLLNQVVNQRDFLGMLAFDKWMANADSRQAIFLRTRVKEFAPTSKEHPRRMGFVALMMDHGCSFDGAHWAYRDSPLHGLYFRTPVYETVRGLDDFPPWLDRIVDFPECVVDEALKGMPPEWVSDEENVLDDLLEKLMRRRNRVADEVRDCASKRGRVFPNWN